MSAPRINRDDSADGSLKRRLAIALRKARRTKGLTQTEVAERAGFALKYVGEVERGIANFTIDTYQALADTVGWDPFDTLAVPEPLREPVRLHLVSELDRVDQRVEAMRALLITLGQRTGGAR